MDFANFWFQDVGSRPVNPDTIGGSLRFRNEGSSASYRLRLTSTAQQGLVAKDQTRWTMSVWLKDIKGRDQSAQGTFFGHHYRSSDSGYTTFSTGKSYGEKPSINYVSGGGVKTCSKWLNDGTAWAHHVLTTNNNGTVQWYVNGEIWQTLSGFSNSWWIPPRNGGFQSMIGCGGNSSAQYWSGFRGSMAQFIFVDGTSYAPTKFGEFDDNGTWVCMSTDRIKAGIDFGNTGYCLEFLDRANLGKDSGPNGINFDSIDGFNTTPGQDVYDLSYDSPSRNICVMQSMFRGNQQPLVEEGGTRFASPGTWKGTVSSHVIQPKTGKYYMEVYCSDAYFGIGDLNNAQPMNLLTNPALITGWAVFRANGNSAYVDQTTVSSSVPKWDNNWTGFTLDTDNNTLKMDGPSGSYTMNYSSYSMANKPIVLVYSNYSGVYRVNHGQQPWRRTPPADAKIVSSATCGVNAPFNVKDYFKAFAYPGTNNGSTADQPKTGVGFKPDLIIFKNRSSGSHNWNWYDSVRGPGGGALASNTGNVADVNSSAGYLVSFDDDGFTTRKGSQAGSAGSRNLNAMGDNYIAYCFRKKEGFFDIVQYTGTSSVRTVSHNLGAEPKLMIIKNLSQSGPDWSVYHYYGGANSAFHLNRDSGNDVQNVFWNNTRPTSSVFTVGNNNTVNQSGNNYIAYLFAEVPGIQHIGEYMGNSGAPEGVMAVCDHKPAFFLTKRRQDTAGWTVWDSGRVPGAQNWQVLYPNSAAAEGGSENSQGVDFYCAGVKQRGAWANANQGSNLYIFWTIAEHSSGINMSPVPANFK